MIKESGRLIIQTAALSLYNEIKNGNLGHDLVDILLYLWYIENELPMHTTLFQSAVRKDGENHLKWGKES